MPQSESPSGGPEGARERLLRLLRHMPRSVDEIAAAMGLTSNAVRFHLAGLERDGVVYRSGVRRAGGPGKPPVLYAITPAAEVALSRAYAPVLAACMEELSATLDAEALEEFLHRAGERLARGAPVDTQRPLEERVRGAAALLRELGGLTSVAEIPDALLIVGHGCPLGAAVARAPRTCLAVRSLLARITGAAVQQRCAHGHRPSCCFVVPRPA